jgi:hypothetical protein
VVSHFAFRFAPVRARALPRRSTSSPLSTEIFEIAADAIVLDSDNVGYIHWNRSQSNRHMVMTLNSTIPTMEGKTLLIDGAISTMTPAPG